MWREPICGPSCSLGTRWEPRPEYTRRPGPTPPQPPQPFTDRPRASARGTRGGGGRCVSNQEVLRNQRACPNHPRTPSTLARTQPLKPTPAAPQTLGSPLPPHTTTTHPPPPPHDAAAHLPRAALDRTPFTSTWWKPASGGALANSVSLVWFVQSSP